LNRTSERSDFSRKVVKIILDFFRRPEHGLRLFDAGDATGLRRKRPSHPSNSVGQSDLPGSSINDDLGSTRPPPDTSEKNPFSGPLASGQRKGDAQKPRGLLWVTAYAAPGRAGEARSAVSSQSSWSNRGSMHSGSGHAPRNAPTMNPRKILSGLI